MISLMTTYGFGVFSSLGKIDDVVVALGAIQVEQVGFRPRLIAVTVSTHR
jgi:hypothetical protein